MHYEWDFGFLWTYSRILWVGVGYTIGFTIITVAAGLTIGALMATARLGKAKLIVLPVTAVMELFRCTPVLVQLIWCYYALPVAVGIELSPAMAAFITLSLYGGAFICRDHPGRHCLDRPWPMDAGRALGLRPVRFDAAHHLAAGDEAHAATARQPVNPAAEEHITAIGRRGA